MSGAFLSSGRSVVSFKPALQRRPQKWFRPKACRINLSVHLFRSVSPSLTSASNPRQILAASALRHPPPNPPFGFIIGLNLSASALSHIRIKSASDRLRSDFTFRLVLLGIPLGLRAIPWIPFARLGSVLLVHQRRSTYPPRTKNLLYDGFLGFRITYLPCLLPLGGAQRSVRITFSFGISSIT